MKRFFLFSVIVLAILLLGISFARTYPDALQNQADVKQVTPSDSLPPMICHDGQLFYLITTIDETELGDPSTWSIAGPITKGSDLNNLPKDNGEINFSLSSLIDRQVYQTADGILFIQMKGTQGPKTVFVMLKPESPPA